MNKNTTDYLEHFSTTYLYLIKFGSISCNPHTFLFAKLHWQWGFDTERARAREPLYLGTDTCIVRRIVRFLPSRLGLLFFLPIPPTLPPPLPSLHVIILFSIFSLLFSSYNGTHAPGIVVSSSSNILSYNTVNTDNPNGPTNNPGSPNTLTPKYKAKAVK